MLGVLCFLRGVSQLVFASGGSLSSCTPSTGTYGCCWDGGWTEGAFVHLSTDAGLTSSFYISFVLTEETASTVCPIEKVANITSEFDWRVTRVGP